MGLPPNLQGEIAVMSFEEVVDKVAGGKIIGAFETSEEAVSYVKDQKEKVTEVEYQDLLAQLRDSFPEDPAVVLFITEEIRQILTM
jgi:hypothetical protein